MLRAEMLESKRAKLMFIVAATLLLAAFQVALQASPAHAWEVRISITGAGQVRETTPANLVGSGCVSPSTTPTGSFGRTCIAGTTSGDYGNFWDVDYVAEPASGYTFKRWESDGSARTAIICDRSTPPATTPTYTGTACKFRTVDNMQTRAVFADEQSPLQPSITSTTPARANGPVAFNFSTSADPTFRGFECRVTPTVQTSFQPCSSGVSYNPSTDGAYTFEVRAVDWSDNTSFPASRSWTVDRSAPFANITAGPSGFSNEPSPSFGFSSSATDLAGFQCSLDGSAFAGCTSPKAYQGLADGRHTFSVRATDTAGNSSTNTRAWTIDTVAPNTTLASTVGPAAGSTTQDNDPVFEFSSDEAGATFECNLTGPGLTSTAFTACNASPGTSPNTFTKSYPNLKDGTYTFRVRAKDAATNVDASPEQRTWTINNTPTVLGGSLTPAKGATGVSRTTDVGATFSEEMAAISLRNPDGTSPAFKLQQFNKKTRKWKSIPATITLGNANTTATLDPFGATEGATERPLAGGQQFRATITTGAKDADGNRLAKSVIWKFTTGRS